VQVGSEVSKDDVSARFREAAATSALAGILQYSDEPLVSSDIVGNSYSCVYDSELTMAHGTSVKLFGWYDNEWGYSCRLVDLVQRL
jgi:glyceraldehyde 3-phosphate dehydrogenase